MLPYDIIVPSKGRPSGSTFALLRNAKLPFIVVVERDDVQKYKPMMGNRADMWILPRSEQGIGYARAYIACRATRPFVMLDDDITKTYRTTMRHELEPCSIDDMLNAGWGIFRTMRGQCALGFKHTSFAIPKQQASTNAVVAHMIFIDPKVLNTMKIAYDKTLLAFEDIDFVFQCFKRGLQVIRLNSYVYYTTPSGTSSTGGIDYGKSATLKRTFLRRMVDKYPGWIVDTGQGTRYGQPKYVITARIPPKPSTQ